MTSTPIDILYIGGFGRSGSTLVERCLGQVDGFFAAGELCHIWDRGITHNQLCGCGVPFRACELWQAIAREAFGGFDAIDGREMMRLSQRVSRTRYIPYLLIRPAAAYRVHFQRFGAALSSLYAAIKKVSGCRVIIDSSKEPSYACVLTALSSLRVSMVHLVRDSRPVAYSWTRQKEIPDVHWKRAYMHRYSAAKSALWWMTFNSLCHGFALRRGRYLPAYYEDFARDPAALLTRILTFAGGDTALPFLRGRVATLAVNHTASGNPTRFLVGPVEIRPDERWRADMARRDRRLVTACTFPYLLAYGYARSAAADRADTRGAPADPRNWTTGARR